LQSKDGAPHVVAAPHHSSEKRLGRASVFLFLLFCIFHFFLFEKIIIPSLKFGPHFMRFFLSFSIYLSLIMERKQILGIGSVFGQGEEKKTSPKFCIGSALPAFFFLSFSLVFARYSHVQGKHSGLK
jgi:hypothetical protein